MNISDTQFMNVARLYESSIYHLELKSRRITLRKVDVLSLELCSLHPLCQGTSARQHFTITGFEPACPLSDLSGKSYKAIKFYINCKPIVYCDNLNLAF